MRVATFYCLAILALAKCAFGAGTVTVTRPTQEVFGTGACMKMQWTNQGFSQTAKITYKVQFFYEDGTNAFEINPDINKYTDITFTEGLKTYNYSVLVYENGVHVGSSANRTIIVADTNCYPEKSTYTHSSKNSSSSLLLDSSSSHFTTSLYFPPMKAIITILISNFYRRECYQG